MPLKERLYRTQILLEPEQHSALSRIARQEGRSISEKVRELIRQQLEQRQSAEDADLQNYLQGLERIRQHREAILTRRGGKPIDIDVVELINQMREERYAHILAVIASPGD